MVRFYAQIVRGGFELFFQSTAKWRNILLIVVCLVLSIASFVGDRSGKRMMEAWIGLQPWYGLIPLGLLLLYGLLRANYNEFRRITEQVRIRDARIQALEGCVSRKLEIVFDEERFRSCRMEWVDSASSTGRILATEIRVRLFRVAVVNTSSVTIDGVRLKLLSFTLQNAPFLPLEMRFMNDETDDFRMSREGAVLSPGEFQLVDIVQKSQDSTEMVLRYAARALPNMIPTREYLLNLVAVGRDVPPVEAQYRIGPDDNGLLFFGRPIE